MVYSEVIISGKHFCGPDLFMSLQRRHASAQSSHCPNFAPAGLHEVADDRVGQLEREIAGLREELATARAQLAEMRAAERPREQAFAFTDYAAVLNQIAEGVILADAAGRIVFINEAAARMHGVARFDITPPGYSSAYDLRTETGLPYPSEDLPVDSDDVGRLFRGEVGH
jgi:PAS domain-containing protein